MFEDQIHRITYLIILHYMPGGKQCSGTNQKSGTHSPGSDYLGNRFLYISTKDGFTGQHVKMEKHIKHEWQQQHGYKCSSNCTHAFFDGHPVLFLEIICDS